MLLIRAVGSYDRVLSLTESYPRLEILFFYFFFPPAPPASCFCSHETTFPSITTPFPSMNATRESPSQFLKLSQTSGCCGVNQHSAISLDFKLWGSSIFLPPVSL